MALNRIEGKEDLYVGGVFGLRNSRTLDEIHITHVLSVIRYSIEGLVDQNGMPRKYEHLSIDVDDMEDEDILVHFPKMVRFIERGLYGPVDASPPSDDENPGSAYKGAVFVHCAMGKSRSVSAVIAYLLWKHPYRFGRSDPSTTATTAVGRALEWVQKSRSLAEPNPGFMEQLQMWWTMGCPTESDDAVEDKPIYQKWRYQREVQESARVGKAPDWLRFEDEEVAGQSQVHASPKDSGTSSSLRCKKCRRVLATAQFVVPHRGTGSALNGTCPHIFVEPLSWMRPTLEGGALEGRLVCPSSKCGASIGRYTWKGFKCSCGEWVCPAFSLQKAKVDQVRDSSSGGMRGSSTVQAASERMAALGIRTPPGANLDTQGTLSTANNNNTAPKGNL